MNLLVALLIASQAGWPAPPADPSPFPPWCSGAIECHVPALEEGAIDLGGGTCLDDGVEGIWNVVDCDTPEDFEAKTGVSPDDELLPRYGSQPGSTYRSYVLQLHERGAVL